MTNYERKLQLRKEQEEKEEKSRKITIIISVVAVLAIIGAVLFTNISASVKKNEGINGTYITVGNHNISKAEYDYYFYTVVNEYATTYSQFLPYMGLDFSQPLDKQQYSEKETWKDAFDEMAVDRITRVKALSDDADAQGFTCDVSADYEDFASSMADGADEAGYKVDSYYMAMYGEFASEKVVESYVKEFLKISAYVEKLTADFTPSDEEVTSIYASNPDNYDLVDYYLAKIQADYDDDKATIEEIDAAVEEARAKATYLYDAVKAGESFDETAAAVIELPEDNPTCIKTGQKKAYIESQINEWLYKEDREIGDLTMIEDEDIDTFFVVKFAKRYYDDTCPDTIANTVSGDKVGEKVEELMSKYELKDVKGELKYLTLDLD